MISISKGANPNYLCKIVEIKNLRKHVNADRLLVFTIDGNDIITSNQTVEGTIAVYFPLECTINTDYLRLNNEYASALLNEDTTKKGYFNEKGRVKATKLRSEKSMGYVAPIDSLSVLIGDKYKGLTKFVGQEFDTVDGILLATKFVNVVRSGGGTGKQQKSVKISKLVDNQFRLHYDTAQLAKNIHKLQPEDIISISWKMHGTSFVSSKILCKRPLKWYERLAKRFGVQVKEEEYGNIYSSRNVVKNGFFNANPQHFYDTDLWALANEQLKTNLLEGESVYGEIVGFTPSGQQIQKGYDYKCKANTFKIYIYRITHTSTQGKVIDLPFFMVEERAKQLGVDTVPPIFFGKADIFVSSSEFTDLRDWREAVIDLLKVRFVYDQDCQFCANVVPAEGIVLRKEGRDAEAFKLKAFRFLERESKELDKGEENIEDAKDEEGS